MTTRHYRPRAETAELLERFAQLRGEGKTIAEAGAALGMSVPAAGHYANRLLARQRDEALNAPVAGPSPSLPVPGAGDWTGAAACRGQWDLFHAPEGQFSESVTEREVREAKAVSLCRSCPVRAQCGESADARGERWGVWAGRTEADREARKREQRNAKRRVRGREVAA